jgi:competence protein ComEA
VAFLLFNDISYYFIIYTGKVSNLISYDNKESVKMKNNKTLHLLVTAIYCCMLLSSTSMAANVPVEMEQVQTTETKININTATAEELAAKLNGIGLNKAKLIVEYREKYGNFVAIEQLKEVKGIGQTILDKNLAILTL